MAPIGWRTVSRKMAEKMFVEKEERMTLKLVREGRRQHEKLLSEELAIWLEMGAVDDLKTG